MKSIRTKITLCLILTVLVGQAASGVASIFLNYNGTMSTVEQMMCETAVLAADRVEQELLAYKVVVMDTGCIPQLSDPSVPIDEKQAIINERVTMHGFQRGNIIGKDGISIFDGKDYSDREYVQQAMQGNIFVSEPLISKITGELSIMVAAPLYTDGVYGSSIAGVVYFVPHETFLNDIVSAIQVGENSRAYMINKSGDTIADVTLDTITVQNIESEAKSDPALGELAAIHASMRQGQNGFGSYISGGAQNVCGICACKRYGRMEHCSHRAADKLSGIHARCHGNQHCGEYSFCNFIHVRGGGCVFPYQQTDESLRRADETSCKGRLGDTDAPF